MTCADRHRNSASKCAQAILGICVFGVIVAAPQAVAMSAKNGVGKVTKVGPYGIVRVRGIEVTQVDADEGIPLVKGDPISTTGRGKVVFEIETNRGSASCENDVGHQPTRLQVAPRKKVGGKKVLIHFAKGATTCSTPGKKVYKYFGLGKGDATIKTIDPVFKVVVTKRSVVVKVRRGVAVVSGKNKKKAVVIGLNGRGRPQLAQQVVVPKGGNPGRPKRITLARTETKTFARLATELDPTADRTPPTTTVVTGPTDPSARVDAKFTFEANEAGVVFSCSIDGGIPRLCTSPQRYLDRDLGRHTFSVKATDSAGNSGSASYSWTIVNASSAIAFESDRNGRYDIYVVNPDGSRETRLTNDPGEDVDPAWSPDGKKLAFESDRDSRKDSEIYVMNADGKGQTRLTTNLAIDRNPKWSPFGKQIAFESDRDGDYEIYFMNADGSGQTRLTRNAARDSDPAWSPDGSRVAFSSDRDGNHEIYVMNADGSSQTRLTRNSAEETNPVWSPDSRKIAFESDRDGNHEIYVMNANGSSQTRLTTNAARDSDPDWSPMGDQIAFASDRDGDLEIYVMNADGSRPIRLTNSPGRDLVPNW